MAYTVKKVAGMSGVSVRTLHFYDELGLLKPAYQAANGYRFYEEEQLLALQQILFYRELGFSLKEIKKLLSRNDFDKLAALRSHRKALQGDLVRIRKLVETIDKTIEHLNGKKKMKTEEMFSGFSPEQQAKHEQYLINRFGEGMKESIALSQMKVKDWTKAEWQQSANEFVEICKDLVGLMGQQCPVDSREVQEVIRRHYHWLKRFWTPTAESYAGHSELIVDSELRKAYEVHHPQLPEFIAAAIKVFAKAELAR
jgi:DNA-binding transcriptional MerR regulator